MSAVGSVVVRFSATIDNEYSNRLPDFLPLEKLSTGRVELTLDEARAVLADAEYNSDLAAVDVGPCGTPLPVFNAYRALALQVRRAIAAADEDVVPSDSVALGRKPRP